jgi:hypothetical protein
MSFGKGFSADASGGWKNHYRRMKRWEQRSLQTLRNLPLSDFHDALDFSIAYFLWCHSLREWLINDNVMTEEELNSELSKYSVWKLCRDIANRTRHFELKRNPTDKDWACYREYEPFSSIIEKRERHRVYVIHDGRKWETSEAIIQTAEMWKQIILAFSSLPQNDNDESA